MANEKWPMMARVVRWWPTPVNGDVLVIVTWWIHVIHVLTTSTMVVGLSIPFETMLHRPIRCFSTGPFGYLFRQPNKIRSWLFCSWDQFNEISATIKVCGCYSIRFFMLFNFYQLDIDNKAFVALVNLWWSTNRKLDRKSSLYRSSQLCSMLSIEYLSIYLSKFLCLSRGKLLLKWNDIDLKVHEVKMLMGL